MKILHGIALLITLVFVVSCDVSGQVTTASQLVIEKDPEALFEQVQTYGAAWASADVDRILALHSERTEFVLYVGGERRAVGKKAVRRQFEIILTDNPNYATKVSALNVGTGFAVIQYEITNGPNGQFRLGNIVYNPDTEDYSVSAVDILIFEDGLVSAKHTYLDTDSIRMHVPRHRQSDE